LVIEPGFLQAWVVCNPAQEIEFFTPSMRGELGDQPDAIAVAFYPEAVAIIFDLVEPVGAAGNGFAGGRDAELVLGRGC
jgi:hypothetical protein